MGKVTKTLFTIYGLPAHYLNSSYRDTALTRVKQEDIENKIKNAPTKGVLVVQGTAGPIVNQLLAQGRKIRGICFTDRSTTAFETHNNPMADVIVLYDVGVEVSLNGKVSGMVLSNIAKHYSGCNTLLIIETVMTKANLLQRYDFSVTNFIKIPQKAEETWI